MHTKLTRVILFAVAAIAISGPSTPADVVQDWNGEALKVTFAVGPPQARVLAIVHIAMHDAINSITGQYKTYAVDQAAPPGASPVAAAAAAAHHVLVTLFPQMTATYDQALATSLEGIPEPSRTDGMLVGQEVGEEILALRMNDGFSAPASYTPGSGPGVWVPTPPAFAPALLPGFGRVRPFALKSGSQFRPDGPPRLTGERWASDLNEVQAIGSVDAERRALRTPAQTATARFWLGNMIPIMQRIAREVSSARQPVRQRALVRLAEHRGRRLVHRRLGLEVRLQLLAARHRHPERGYRRQSSDHRRPILDAVRHDPAVP